jgi:16S rRNA (cytosine1402-N4)-methyltransferase
MLLDLGVSSHQLNEPSRGFSFMRDGPLDMRMAQTATASGSDSNSSGDGGVRLDVRDAERARRAEPLTAATIVNQWDEKALADVLWKYGEERESRRIARSIVAARPLHSTAELVEVLKTAGTKNYEPKEVRNRLSRVFQALRIEVNQEMAELEAVLLAAARLVRPGGRLAVMSYHSLEDRRVKRLLRSGSFGDGTPPKDAYGNELAPWKPLTRQAITPSEAELEVNSRARSVRLRVGERTEHEPPPVLK